MISGESSDELVVLATQDLSGQILHVRLAGDSRLNQRGSIYMGAVSYTHLTLPTKT